MTELNDMNHSLARPAATSDSLAANHVRLSPREWLVALVVVSALFVLVPKLWERAEPLRAGSDYRIPYSLSNDYWLFRRSVSTACAEETVLVLGDSVIWGHYVKAAETLPHYLNEQVGAERFSNLGVDGIHPAALAGLVQHHGRTIEGKDILLHLNLLWMSSARRDLRERKEFRFNHPRLVPQFYPSIPCYTEPVSGRIGVVVERYLPFSGWAQHLRLTSFTTDETSDVPTWTMKHPYASPFDALTLELPSPDEPVSPPVVAQPWTEQGLRKANFPWVDLETSFQWASFTRTVALLQARGNRVFVLLGPLNEHMLTEESRQIYQDLKKIARAWLELNTVPAAVPEALASERYADVSHPLAEGYERIAEGLFADTTFVRFLSGKEAHQP